MHTNAGNRAPGETSTSTEQPADGGYHSQLPKTISVMMERSQAAFRRDLPQLLQERPGQWVAYHGDVRIGFGSSKRVLYQECLRQGLPIGDFAVRSIEPEVPRELADLPDV